MSQPEYVVQEGRVEMFVPTGRELYARDIIGLVTKLNPESGLMWDEREGKYYVVPLKFVKRYEQGGTRYVISRVES